MASVVLMVPCQPKLLKNHVLHGNFHTKAASYSYPVIRNEKNSSFSYKSTVHVPIYELPGVLLFSFHFSPIAILLLYVSVPNTHVNLLCRLLLTNIWMTRPEYSEQCFLTKEQLNSSVRYFKFIIKNIDSTWVKGMWPF